MILKGRSRGHGSQLARYLFHEKNKSITVLDLRGTCASDLTRDGLLDALKEFDEYAKLTQGSKTIFHLAIAPADQDRMDAEKWQYAVAKAEEALGFIDQPRAVVMHEYEGKEHLHVAWSRVDLEELKLKSDSFTNLKLCNAARDIEMDLGLFRLPDIHRGHVKEGHHEEEERKPKQRELEIKHFQEEQGHHTQTELKSAIENAWLQSDSGEEFRAVLEQHSYRPVKGRRGVLIMDEEGNVYSPARYIEGVKVKEVNAKCVDIWDDLQGVDQAREREKELVLTPRRAAKLTRTRLRLELSNDPMQPPREVLETEEYDP